MWSLLHREHITQCPPAEPVHPALHQLSKDRGRGLGVPQRGVRRIDREAQHLHHPRQTRRLTRRQIKHQPGQGRSVEHRILQRLWKPATDQIRVERVVRVLDERGTSANARKA